MNSNTQNPKIVGVELLKNLQILYQNNAISTMDKDNTASYIKEGMRDGTFYKLNNKLFDILETTSLPHVVEDMIEIITF